MVRLSKCELVAASTSCTVTRTSWPERCTLPSTTLPTRRSATSESNETSVSRYRLTPLRDTTSSASTWLSSWINISVRPFAR
jgi:hypothetical protein